MKSSKLNIVGQCLLWCGFLGGSFAAVLRLETSPDPWQTIPWIPYAVSASVGVVGVVLLRSDKARRRTASAASQSGLDAIADKLQAAAESVAWLAARADELSCEEVLDDIDQRCGPLLSEFADGRQVIADRFGTAAYALIMTEFASGERYLNRAWSAAADGYVDEVVTSLNHANTFLTAANDKMLDIRRTTF